MRAPTQAGQAGQVSTAHDLHCHALLRVFCCARSVGVNKGGVAIGLQVGSTHIAFVGSHLAAHQSKTQMRNRGRRAWETGCPLP